MSVYTPGFLGLILRKNDRTSPFIEREIKFIAGRSNEGENNLNEDEYLIGFSVAMNGQDLELAIEGLEKEGAVYGTDFVATSSVDGVLDEVPEWLTLVEEHVEDPTQPDRKTKIYSLTANG